MEPPGGMPFLIKEFFNDIPRGKIVPMDKRLDKREIEVIRN
jgi:hypothetical protein